MTARSAGYLLLVEASMARVPLALTDRRKQPSFLTRRALAYARKSYGADLDNALATSHHPGVFWPWGLMELAGERRRSVLPQHLDHLVVFVTAVQLGCSWCVDFGASLWERKGLDPVVLREALRWPTSAAFDADTRAAFGYAEAVSGDLANVQDAMVADLRERFGDAGLVELTYLIALENMRARFNTSLGLTSQGFSSGAACVAGSGAARVAGSGAARVAGSGAARVAGSGAARAVPQQHGAQRQPTDS